MQTVKLRALQQPTLIEVLLDSLSITQSWVPPGSSLITHRSELMSGMQKLAMKAVKGEGAWRAWNTSDGVLFFVAEMSMALSRERGCPALKVHHYNDEGKLQKYGVWIQLAGGAWQNCAI